jgi:hypothetical protein
MKPFCGKEWAGLSPGVGSFCEAVHHPFGAGLACFDLLGERVFWEDRRADGWLEHAGIRLYPDTVSGRAAHVID